MRVKINSKEKIQTENPLEELWLQIRLFESEYYTTQFLKEKYQDITNEELNNLSVIFTSNIKQAFEYYSAASNVSILTSPLLYYYGMMCLTKVLWLSLNKTEKIKLSHGLWSDSDGLNDLLSDEYVINHNKGSFPALHSCFSDFPIEKNTKFYIKNVFSVIPDIKILYEKIYNEKSYCIKFTRNDYVLECNHADLMYFHDILKKNTEIFKRRYNVPIYILNSLSEKKPFVITYDRIKDTTMFEYPLQKNLNEEIFFTLPIKVGNTFCALPEASAHFMIMHCLGMLVRYEPVKWLQIVNGKLSSEINIINRFIEISKRKFPNIILNGLLGREIQFINSRN